MGVFFDAASGSGCIGPTAALSRPPVERTQRLDLSIDDGPGVLLHERAWREHGNT